MSTPIKRAGSLVADAATSQGRSTAQYFGAHSAKREEMTSVWWQDLLWGFWNGLTAWIVLIGHLFGAWEGFPFYNAARSGNWYDFGFLIGAGSPLLGAIRGARGW